MVGAEAEKTCLGLKPIGDDDDRVQIALMMDEIRPAPIV
jgi:hypothetical protein